MCLPTKENLQVEVRNSPVHGNGVFALSKISAGTLVCVYKGEIITRDEMELRDSLRSRDNSIFVFEIDDETFLDASRITENNLARYINHSCDENCEAVWNDSSRQMEIRALRDIVAGEEISFDYGFGLSGFFEHPCRCGAKNCVHYIVAKILRPALAKKLARHGNAKNFGNLNK